jgi:IS30 family transposase
MVMFNTRMRPEVIQPFWAALQAGEFISAAAEGVGTYRVKGRRWILAESGIRPRRGRDLKGRCLTFTEREEIALGRARGESVRCIARRLGRAPSTVSRELCRNVDRRGEYRATSAHALAWQRASRPKPAKLWVNQRLRAIVEDLLERRYSPEQIAGRLRVQFPADPEMWVSTETIYQSLYVTSRGALRRELTKCLRTGRKLRHPGLHGRRSQRPPRHDQHRRAPPGGR